MLGPPDSDAGEMVPSADPNELLSLGSGGIIVLAFNDGGIENGEGVDFTVFENVFLAGGNLPFTETAVVEVSEDGESWFQFSYDSETLVGLAGLTPTHGSEDPTDPSRSGGDSFDLEEVGLARAVYVRLTDSEGLVVDGGSSFDLDAVVAVNGENGTGVEESVIPQKIALRVWPNPFNSRVTIETGKTFSENTSIEVFDVLGRVIFKKNISSGSFTWEPDRLNSGIYLLRVSDKHGNSKSIKLNYLK